VPVGFARPSLGRQTEIHFQALRSAFSPWSDCFDLAHPDHPFMQVRFQDAPAEADERSRKAAKLTEETGGDEDPVEGLVDLASLLPDEASSNQRKRQNSGEHFTKRERLADLGGFAAAMLLSGVNVIGVGGGGGYFSPGAKGAAFARLALPDAAGTTHGLWRSAWMNVAPATHPGLTGATGRPMPPELTFGWMAPSLRRTRGKSADDKESGLADKGLVRLGGREELIHTCAFMWGMARRCELAQPGLGVCSLTGIEGPVWLKVEVQPGGPRCPVLRRSWHPLIGIRRSAAKENDNGKASVNRGPETGVFRALEWSSFFPLKSGSVADLVASGMPPSAAMLVDSDRRDAVNRMLRSGANMKTPTLPLMGVAIRQDKVLEGWSEGSMRLWTGDRRMLSNIYETLRTLKEGAAEAQKMIVAAADAAERHAPDLRSGKDAKGFKARLKSNMAAAVEARHDEIGAEAIDEVAQIGAHLGDDAEDAIVELGGRLGVSLSEACLNVVRRTDFGPLGGAIVRAAAVLAAEAVAGKQDSARRGGNDSGHYGSVRWL